ncbi:TIGR03617 family F420-dependent LLM class oxidoreductase [Gordonia terrae]|uniref:TIGR03617 family F420-dependent LLM class oxidoreductase n=1 Tax=Gordonia terrae TaxID=2055 RepID=UPI00200B35F5|nr:TIGR03617 family F420-dependent LLM class oxidoreductase [Gordonia terrae]UPW08598.1 TIGR03617 family F420-dependent LLM class oxidoreductase [Gordonia terrae]
MTSLRNHRTARVALPIMPPGQRLADTAELALAAEDAGLDGISYPELSSDPLLHLTVAAGVTSRVDLMTNILVAFARSPMTLAEQARALQDYSGGRLILGLGSQIKPHIERRFSMPWSAPAARMDEFVTALRAIWSAWETGEPLDFNGRFYTHTLMTPMFTPPTERPNPKVFIAAVGEKMCETAGRSADGMLVHGFSTARYLEEVTLPALRRGAGGSLPEDFEIVDLTFLVTGRTAEERTASAAAVRRQLAFYASTPAYLPVLALHGWEDVGHEMHALSRSDRPDRWEVMGERLPDEVLETFAVVGDPDEVPRMLVERGAGIVSRYSVNALGIDDPRLVFRLARGIQEATR